MSADLFGVERTVEHLTVLPVSVIDIGPQKKRIAEDHGSTSSRQNFSPFPAEVATLCAEFFLRDSTIIFDPFAGWGERGRAILDSGKQYIGFDVSEDAIAKAKAEYGVENTLADSAVANIPMFDGLITCPPYWNLEKYQSSQSIDRLKTCEEFCDVLEFIFDRAYDAAQVGAMFCVMVGDWRSKGVYYDLTRCVENMFVNFGATTIDKVVISRAKVSKIKIMLPQCKRLGYTVHVHETLLVYQKR